MPTPGSREVDIEALLSKVGDSRPSQFCWAYNLEGQVREYLTAVEEMVADGKPVNGAQVKRDLQEHFGLKLDGSKVRTHLKGECASCPKKPKP